MTEQRVNKKFNWQDFKMHTAAMLKMWCECTILGRGHQNCNW